MTAEDLEVPPSDAGSTKKLLALCWECLPPPTGFRLNVHDALRAIIRRETEGRADG